MERILTAAGLASANAEQRDVRGEPVIVVAIEGDGQQEWRRVRAALPDHYPVLVLDDISDALDPIWFDDDPRNSPADVLARAASIDVEARIGGFEDWDEEGLGTGDDGYYLDHYDVAHFGSPKFMVILPRPEPWAAFAYLRSVFTVLGYKPELLVAAAHRWHDRYGAEPTVVGIATGFVVARPPTDLADAERLAAEHLFLAALTAGTSPRAYAQALLRLDRWALYDRP